MSLIKVKGSSITGDLPAISGANLTGISTGVAGITTASSSGTAISIDSSNRVTISVPAFRATSTSGWHNVTAGNVINFNVTTSGGNNIQTNHDALLNYDNTNKRFTAPIAGTYLFYAQLYTHEDGNLQTFSFYKNGSYMAVYDTNSQFLLAQDGSALDRTYHMQATFELQANDYIDCRSTNNATDVYGLYSLFGGFMIGKSRT
jgi:hypothetical protein